ncbi:MAG: sugar ABC transporter permease [Sphaerochaetaceae bacterium]|nr:sugar ABC transporter permease [Sphaerochaetaceae bacterium]
MKKSTNRIVKEQPILYLLPALLVLAVLVFVPLMTNIIKSFSYKDSFSLANYRRLFTDKQFLKDLKNTFAWLLYTLPFEMVLGLFIAILLNMKIRFQKFFRTLFIIPWVIPATVVCIIWKWMYNADYGILNSILMKLHIISKYQLWLASAQQSLPCQAAVYVWKISPFVMIMYLSGLQGISPDIYEAARIDGANWFVQTFKITIPLLVSVMRSVILVSTIWALNSFVYVYSLTGGGPARVSETVQIFIYKTGIEQFKFEYSATAANVFLVIVMIVALINIKVGDKTEEKTQ